MSKWKKFLSLTFHNKLFIALTMLAFPLVRFGLRLLGLKNLLILLQHFSPDITGVGESRYLVEKASLISSPINMGRPLLRMTCLEVSIVLWWLLRWQNIDSVLCLGIPRKAEKPFEAHAWIECCGTVVNDVSDIRNRYNVLVVYDRH